jgi:hypothetical protein
MKQGYFARLAGRSGLLSPKPFPSKPEAVSGVSDLETHVELESQSPLPVQSTTAQLVNIQEPASAVTSLTSVEAADTDVPAGVQPEAGPLNELSLQSIPKVSRRADPQVNFEAAISEPLSTEDGIQAARIGAVASGQPDVQAQPLPRQTMIREAAVTPVSEGVELRDGITRSVLPKLPVQSIAGLSRETGAPDSGDSPIMEHHYAVDDSAATIERTRSSPEQNRSPHVRVTSQASHRTQTVSRSEMSRRPEPDANGYLQHPPEPMAPPTPTVHIGRISVSVQSPAPKPAAATAVKPRRRGGGKATASSPRLSRYYLRNI